jgi:hypothetical protein
MVIAALPPPQPAPTRPGTHMRTRDHPPPRPRHLMALPPPVGRRHRAAYSRRSLAGAATLMPSRGFATAVREAAEAVVGPLSALRGASGPDPHRSPPPLSPLSTAAGASWRLGPPPRAIEVLVLIPVPHRVPVALAPRWGPGMSFKCPPP